ncbi:MAG: substrate-binding domain-containing protein [Oscillibacter sp.]|jgi:ribose transport system substrate-binding protein|nr:substrate-binding domain-containing protein [Oscillibacter sp.]
MKLKRGLALILTCVLLVGLLAGCGGKDSGDATGDTSGDATGDTSGDTGDTSGGGASGGNYAIVVKSLADQYWVLLKAGAEAKAKELGVTVSVIGPNSESDVQGQVDMIQNKIGEGVDGLAIAPSSPDAVLPVLAQADSAGIPVLAVDTDIPGYENKKSFIGTGNEAAGKQGGEYAAGIAGEGAKAIVLRGRLGDTTHDQREDGIVAGLEAGGVEILEVKPCDSEAEKAMNAMQDLLNVYDQIDIVVTTADSMAQGAQRAIENASKDIPVVGFDGTIPVAELIAQGSVIKGSVAQAPYAMGELCVENLIALHNGETIEERIDSGTSMVTPDNAQQFKEDLEAKVGGAA